MKTLRLQGQGSAGSGPAGGGAQVLDDLQEEEAGDESGDFCAAGHPGAEEEPGRWDFPRTSEAAMVAPWRVREPAGQEDRHAQEVITTWSPPCGEGRGLGEGW